MAYMKLWTTVALLLVCAPYAYSSGDIPLIDAHSQMARGLDVEKIIPLMDEAGVNVTLLSARNDRSPADVIQFAAVHPDRIIPMVRTKGKSFNNSTPNYYSFMKKQLANPAFKGMAEILLYHAQKGKKAPEIVAYPDDPQAVFAIDACLERGWPVVIHIEFAAAKGKKKTFMEKLNKLLRDHPDHPFLLIHMGQLRIDAVGKLINNHRNVHFMTSHSNPLSAKGGKQPWVNMFEGKQLSGEWEQLMLDHPDRFVLAFDNVWPNHWGDYYLKQVRMWRMALSKMPTDAAHAIAHGNAERLWKLAPVQ